MGTRSESSGTSISPCIPDKSTFSWAANAIAKGEATRTVQDKRGYQLKNLRRTRLYMHHSIMDSELTLTLAVLQGLLLQWRGL